MADFDSNILKPVEGLQSITGPIPAARRQQEKKRRQKFYMDEQAKKARQMDESASEPALKEPSELVVEEDNMPNSSKIDYCA
jgi:hypothetical protein